MQVHRDSLSNHLEVVVIELPHLHSCEIGLLLRVGPRFERMVDSGLAHFTEHMLFRGTRGRNETLKLHAEVERLGSPISAATARDFGQYCLAVPPRFVERALALFADIVSEPTFDGIDLERAIILEEFLADLDEEGLDINPENHSRALLWPGGSLSLNILGTEENIRRFCREDLTRHHERYYTGRNAVLYFSGAIERVEAMALAERYFGRLPAGEILEIPSAGSTLQGPQVIFIPTDDSQDHLNLSFLAPAFTDSSHPVMALMQSLLTDGISSRLQWHLCEKLGLVYELDAGYEGYFDTGVFDVEASAKADKTVALLREILNVLEELRVSPVSDDELERAKERYRIGLEFALDSPGQLASYFATSALYARVPSLELQLQRVESVSAEDLQSLAREVFQPRNLAMVVSGRQKKKERREMLGMVHGAWKS